MGRLLEPDEEDWDLPDEEALKELSPLQEPHQHGLFQRIARQRAAYFADIEMVPDGGDDEGSVSPPSGFAELSTWCCDAFPSARQRSASLREDAPRDIPIVDQPTVPLSLLTALQMHIADIPTVPDLCTLNLSPSTNVPEQIHSFSSKVTSLRRLIAHIFHRLLCAWRNAIHQRRRSERVRPPVSQGHALLMQRLREREQGGLSARAYNSQYTRQVRLPADRLVR